MERQTEGQAVGDKAPVALLRDDAAVINTAMPAFFEKRVWDQNDWTEGDFIVVMPEWRSKTRLSFESSLGDAIKWYGGYEGTVEIAKKLRDLKASIRRDGPRFDPGPVKPLKRMELDERIVLGEVERKFWTLDREIEIYNRVGKQGTVRVTGCLYPPAYSHDGRYACVKMIWVPWSIHGADLFFFLERTKDGWKIVHVMEWIYA